MSNYHHRNAYNSYNHIGFADSGNRDLDGLEWKWRPRESRPPLLRPVSPPLENRIPVWTSEAACLGDDRYLYPENPHDHRSKAGRKFHQEARLAALEAAYACRSCPVLDLCRSNATDADYFWTVRAGKIPEAFDKPERDAKIEATPDLRIRDNTCIRGHVGEWRQRKNKYRYCQGCNRELQAERAAKMKG